MYFIKSVGGEAALAPLVIAVSDAHQIDLPELNAYVDDFVLARKTGDELLTLIRIVLFAGDTCAIET